ncbi:MAG TPA: phosphohydrolase [Nitrospiraceae bacterium]|nr:phosphohydrolase [Nitrospiraceae bacterium]
MNDPGVIEKIAAEVKRRLEGEGSGHDWWHTYRVWKISRHIGIGEGADLFVIELAAFLHDIADHKFHNGDLTVGPAVARQMLAGYSLPDEVIDHVCDIIGTMSYKGAGVKTDMRTLEGKVVQDADRIDAIGAIGIARAFAYGGYKNRPIHVPGEEPILHQSKEAYFKSNGASINHFYEKLLLLKDRMNTEMAKKIAEYRHMFMEEYLNRFFKEWEGDL